LETVFPNKDLVQQFGIAMPQSELNRPLGVPQDYANQLMFDFVSHLTNEYHQSYAPEIDVWTVDGSRITKKV
jgi:hypothetical protein